ncbi:MAG: hypothetical protein V1772_02525, partial [Chloroflexota bacterium]
MRQLRHAVRMLLLVVMALSALLSGEAPAPGIVRAQASAPSPVARPLQGRLAHSLYELYLAASADGPVLSALATARGLTLAEDGRTRVVVHLRAGTDVQRLYALGFAPEVRVGQAFQGLLPVGRLATAAQLDEVALVRPPLAPLA